MKTNQVQVTRRDRLPVTVVPLGPDPKCHMSKLLMVIKITGDKDKDMDRNNNNNWLEVSPSGSQFKNSKCRPSSKWLLLFFNC